MQFQLQIPVISASAVIGWPIAIPVNGGGDRRRKRIAYWIVEWVAAAVVKCLVEHQRIDHQRSLRRLYTDWRKSKAGQIVVRRSSRVWTGASVEIASNTLIDIIPQLISAVSSQSVSFNPQYLNRCWSVSVKWITVPRSDCADTQMSVMMKW